MMKHGRGHSMPMAAYGWTNADSPVPTSFAYAVPPPPSYEEYEFSGRLIY